MNFSKTVTLTNSDVDYRLLDKSAFRSLSEILADVLSKYGCIFAQNRQFSISTTSNTVQKNISNFDECFDNRAVYDTISLFASGKTPDKSKRLDIIVGLNFVLSKPSCHITLAGTGFTDAQLTDVFEAIGNFIYETAKVELPEQPSNSTTDNETTERMEKEDSASPKKPTIKQRISDFFHLVGGTKSFIELIKLIWSFFS